MTWYQITIQDRGNELSERTEFFNADRGDDGDEAVIEELREWYGEDIVIIDFEEVV